MRTRTRIVLLATALAVLALVPAASTAAGPAAHAARGCSVGTGRGYGPTYLLKLSVRHTTCRHGRELVLAYNKCRRSHGGRKGHCSGVLGYSCSETRFNKSAQSFDARVACKKSGGRRINHTYTQFT
jgi:hypothetical protein